MTTAYVTHPRYTEHDLAGHVEHAGRIRAVWAGLEEAGLLPQMVAKEAEMVSEAQILSVHTPDYLALLKRIPTFDRTVRLDNDTYANPTSYDVARLSAGAAVMAVDSVLSGETNNAFAAARPPGHHAEPQRGMGFCLLSNIAIAARHAQQQYGIERILIVDYDVHHGNGTEAVFYDDPSVLFISTHKYQPMFYPGTGAVNDTGSGKGRGYTLNIPLDAGVGDVGYADVFERIVLPAAERFQPQLILVSAGYDAHWMDPLGGMGLTLTGFAHLSQQLVDAANRLCGGKIAFVMEGGYNLDVLSEGMSNVARVLLGQEAQDTLGAPDTALREPDLNALIERIRTVHQL